MHSRDFLARDAGLMQPVPRSDFRAREEPYSLREGVRPLVILGAARSGTKFLRQLLATSSACVAVAHGLNHVWRPTAHHHPHDAVLPDSYTPAARRSIRKTILRLSEYHAAPDARFVIERTCANTLRLPAVHAVLPDARYVHIVRDGRDVAASAWEQWSQSPSLLHQLRKLISAPRAGWRYATRRLADRSLRTSVPAGWGPHYPGMEQDMQQYATAEVCGLQWAACVETCQDGLASLVPASRALTIRYERLVTDPDTVQALCQFIDLPDSLAVLNRYRRTVRADSIGRWKRTFDPPTMQRVHSHIKATLQRLNYPV